MDKAKPKILTNNELKNVKLDLLVSNYKYASFNAMGMEKIHGQVVKAWQRRNHVAMGSKPVLSNTRK